MILLDTSVVSAVLRRRRKGEAEDALARKVDALLSGIPERSQYEKVFAGARESFSVVLATEGDHLKAADIAHTASAKGIAVSTPDALIAAQAINRRAALLTTDADFGRLARLAGLRLA